MTERAIPSIIAHRGASGYAPENTFAAFDKALELGFPDIEFDVRATKDGVPMVIHDATVDRTTDASTVLSTSASTVLSTSALAVFGTGASTGLSASGSYPVAELTLAEVKRLDAGAWFGPEFAGQRVPTLEEIFARYVGRARFQVEIKAPGVGLEVKVMALAARYGVRASCAVSSFEPSVIGELAPVAASGFPVRWLVSRLDQETIEGALRLGANGLNAHVEALTPKLTEAARSRGLRLGAWGAETEEHVARALRCGVDGFTHNYPDVARAQLERLGVGRW